MSDLIEKTSCARCFEIMPIEQLIAHWADKHETCAWCGEETLDWNASPNGKDICNDCEDKALEESED